MIHNQQQCDDPQAATSPAADGRAVDSRIRAVRRPTGAERGYVMLLIVATLAAMAMAMYRIIPQYAFQAQRDKEEELIFRGEAYRQAIQLYVRKFGRYPGTLEELVQTNNIRFIRQLYKDPLSEDGEWRVIHIGPGGTFPDSKVLTSSGTVNTGLTPSTMTLSNPGAPLGPAPGESKDISQQGSADGRTPNRQAQSVGGAIAGVASFSEQSSIRIWNEQTSYDKWEFIYNYRNDPIAMAGPMGQQQQPGGQPTGGLPPTGRGTTGPGGAPSNPGFGAPPTSLPPGTGNPFGGGPNNPGGAGSIPGRGLPFGIPPGAGTGGNPTQPGDPRRF